MTYSKPLAAIAAAVLVSCGLGPRPAKADPTDTTSVPLQIDLGATGDVELCQYMNGQVYAGDPSLGCPIAVVVPASVVSSMIGHLAGHDVDGGTASICVYSTNGGPRIVQFGGGTTCPDNYVF
jgi:hypothetical protein